jgi:hypothetical protein
VYHDTLSLNDDIDEVYQEEELPPSFIVDPGAGLNDLVGDACHCEAKTETNKENSSIA